MNHNKIGQFIASCRKAKGLTQQELGEKLFITDKAVSKWERGASLPDVGLLQKLAKVLDVEVIDILEGEKNMSKNKNMKEELEKFKRETEKRNKKQKKKILFCIAILLFIILYLLFRNIYLGYSFKKVYYPHTSREINIALPKFSFLEKINDRSYS